MRPHNLPEHVTDLWNRQRKKFLYSFYRIMRTCLSIPSSHDGEIGMGKHDQGDMPVPGSPQTDLVVIEPDFLFGCLEDLLDFPAGSCHPDHLLQCCPPWPIHQVECEFCPIRDTTTDE